METTIEQFESALEKGNLVFRRTLMVYINRTVVAERETNIPMILIEHKNRDTGNVVKHLKVDYENTTTVKGKIYQGYHTLTEVIIPDKRGRGRTAIWRTVIS